MFIVWLLPSDKREAHGGLFAQQQQQQRHAHAHAYEPGYGSQPRAHAAAGHLPQGGGSQSFVGAAQQAHYEHAKAYTMQEGARPSRDDGGHGAGEHENELYAAMEEMDFWKVRRPPCDRHPARPSLGLTRRGVLAVGGWGLRAARRQRHFRNETRVSVYSFVVTMMIEYSSIMQNVTHDIMPSLVVHFDKNMVRLLASGGACLRAGAS
eukprot:scaffold5014_cov387-Prasinococcus_capsulatus_cf.AAC.4